MPTANRPGSSAASSSGDYVRGQVEHGVLFWIGLVIGFALIVMTANFAVKLFGIIGQKPDAATMDSFQLLRQQLEVLREGEQRNVPYHIGEKFFLVSGPLSCPESQLCLCTDHDCAKVVENGIIQIAGRRFSPVRIVGKNWKGVENLEIGRSQNVLRVGKADMENLK